MVDWKKPRRVGYFVGYFKQLYYSANTVQVNRAC